MSEPLRVLISGGGTGGGVYPALAVAQALPHARLLWMGSRHGVEVDLVARAGLDYVGVPAGPLVGVGLRAIPNAVKLLAGTIRALGIVRRFRPGVLLITGGWATIPAALACWLSRVPVVIYLPDLEPGGAIRVLSRLAARVAITAPSAARYFRPGQAIETGYPLRSDLLEVAGFDPSGKPLDQPPDSRAEARARFGLSPDLPTLLVFGGSRGARSINRATMARLRDLLGSADQPNCQIVHISGTLDWQWVQEQAAVLPADLAVRYHPFEYLHSRDMALALAAADLVVARAGASTLGEFPLFGIPAILVPYPHAWRYQKVNADYLVSRGAAVRLDDNRLNDDLAPLVHQLLADPARHAGMAAAARALRRPDAAARLAALLAALAAD